MIIDCDQCEMRDVACDDCVVTALLGAESGEDLGGETLTALKVLADGGLVPPLRMHWPEPGHRHNYQGRRAASE